MKVYNLTDILESFDIATWLAGETTDMDRAIQNNVKDALGKTVVFDVELSIPNSLYLSTLDYKTYYPCKHICRFFINVQNFKSVQIVDEFGNIFQRKDKLWQVDSLNVIYMDEPPFLDEKYFFADLFIHMDTKYINQKSVNVKIFITFEEDSEVIDLSHLFKRSENLLNVNNVTLPLGVDSFTAKDMFSACEKLKNVKGLDMRRIIDMSGMFQYCKNLRNFKEEIRIDNCDNLDDCFYGCKKLTCLPIKQLRGGNALRSFTMKDAFKGCTSLKHLDLFWTVPEDVPFYHLNTLGMFTECYAMSDNDLNTWGWERDIYTTEIWENNDLINSAELIPYLKASLK